MVGYKKGGGEAGGMRGLYIVFVWAIGCCASCWSGGRAGEHVRRCSGIFYGMDFWAILRH
ncbi:hypothetical protein BDU57DRAFT_78509 [Ampelomyces quisqualis]|uniref:Uncharacterized protein n=1 Tax=Ampelomyces quisqualis TaxID=50730 RepID=A0A6A5Q9I2_AMPQU|nr:hypothetical protein BDU57DRAFT_78509 [Ampelomyces quisqualis]